MAHKTRFENAELHDTTSIFREGSDIEKPPIQDLSVRSSSESSSSGLSRSFSAIRSSRLPDRVNPSRLTPRILTDRGFQYMTNKKNLIRRDIRRVEEMEHGPVAFHEGQPSRFKRMDEVSAEKDNSENNEKCTDDESTLAPRLTTHLTSADLFTGSSSLHRDIRRMKETLSTSYGRPCSGMEQVTKGRTQVPEGSNDLLVEHGTPRIWFLHPNFSDHCPTVSFYLTRDSSNGPPSVESMNSKPIVFKCITKTPRNAVEKHEAPKNNDVGEN